MATRRPGEGPYPSLRRTHILRWMRSRKMPPCRLERRAREVEARAEAEAEVEIGVAMGVALGVEMEVGMEVGMGMGAEERAADILYRRV